MADIPIPEQHQRELTRLQSVLEWLQAEQQRLLAELQHIAQMGEREQQKLMTRLQQMGVDTSRGLTSLDSERGVVVVPDPAPAPASAPASLSAIPGPSDEGSVPADPGLPDPQDSAAAEQAREDAQADAPIPLRRAKK